MREFYQFLSHRYTTIGTGSFAHTPSGTSWQPHIDVFEREDRFIIVVELPGVRKEQIEAHVENGILQIKGTREKRIPQGTTHVHQLEIPYGSFTRLLQLPQSADVKRIEAQYEDGFLTIEIPRNQL